MTDKLRAAAASLRGSSPIADALLDRQVFASHSAADSMSDSDMESFIERLLTDDSIDDSDPQKTISDLIQIIIRLKQELDDSQVEGDEEEDEDESSTDEALHVNLEKFRKSIRNMKAADLKLAYDERFFKPLKPKTRKLLASELIDYASFGSTQVVPSELWIRIENRNGVL